MYGLEVRRYEKRMEFVSIIAFRWSICSSISGLYFWAKAKINLLSSPCCSLLSSEKVSPWSFRKSSRDTLGVARGPLVRLSSALIFSPSVNDSTNDRLSYCSSSNTSILWSYLSFARTGEEPQKDGVTEKSLPSTKVQLRERWCPSNLHPQFLFVDGVPKNDR